MADILRQHAAAYRAALALLPSQQRAQRDLENCRTAYFGGHVAQCDHCGLLHYTYHSCRNRHCPKCHGQQADAWLECQQTLLLPGPHYLLTFTLPAPLRSLAFNHQKLVYGALLQCAAAALLKLTQDPQWLGATPTVLAVLRPIRPPTEGWVYSFTVPLIRRIFFPEGISVFLLPSLVTNSKSLYF